MSSDDAEVLEKFKTDVARFSGNYNEFLVIVKAKNGNLQWKSSDKTWAMGAAARYLNCIDEVDREEERRNLT